MTKKKWMPVMLYFIVWLISYGVFFIISPGDAMAYGLLFRWGVLPIAALITSAWISMNGQWSKAALAILGVVYGAMYMLLPYMTYSMANYWSKIAAMRDGLPTPDFELFLWGILFFVVGFFGGKAITKLQKR